MLNRDDITADYRLPSKVLADVGFAAINHHARRQDCPPGPKVSD